MYVSLLVSGRTAISSRWFVTNYFSSFFPNFQWRLFCTRAYPSHSFCMWLINNIVIINVVAWSRYRCVIRRSCLSWFRVRRRSVYDLILLLFSLNVVGRVFLNLYLAVCPITTLVGGRECTHLVFPVLPCAHPLYSLLASISVVHDPGQYLAQSSPVPFHINHIRTP